MNLDGKNFNDLNINEGQLFTIEGKSYYFKNENGKTAIYTNYNDKVMDFSYGEIKKSITHSVKESYGDYILAEILTENNIDFTVNYIYYDVLNNMFYDDIPGIKSFDKPCKKVILKQGGYIECGEFLKEEEEKKDEEKEEENKEPIKTEEVKNEEEIEPIKIEGQVFKDIEKINLEFKYKEFKNGENLFIVRDDTEYQNYMINKINEFTTFTYFTVFFIFIFLSFYLIKTLLGKRNF